MAKLNERSMSADLLHLRVGPPLHNHKSKIEIGNRIDLSCAAGGGGGRAGRAAATDTEHQLSPVLLLGETVTSTGLTFG
jgi:hypothetical protein